MQKRKQEAEEEEGTSEDSIHKGKDSKESISLRSMCSSHTTCNLDDLLGHTALVNV